MIEGALNVDSAKEFESGKITATVTYNTRYIHSNGEPVCITFSLGAFGLAIFEWNHMPAVQKT